MRKSLLMIVLTAVSSCAVAGWDKVYGDNQITLYVDLGTIRKNGDLVKMWFLIDKKQAIQIGTSTPFMSVKVQSEFDCKNEQTRSVALIERAGNLDSGEVVRTQSDAYRKWEPVPPGGGTELLWKIACTVR